jgi:pre-rRNA-processing protein IPI3
VSPDGQWTAGGTQEGQVLFWETRTGDLLARFDAHYKRISVIRFGNDCVYTGSDDAVIRVWSIDEYVLYDAE